MKNKKRVLMLGDSPFLQTGFGRVNQRVAKTFFENGWQVGAITALDESPPQDSFIRTWPASRGDEIGAAKIEEAVKDFKPDLIYITAELGTFHSLYYYSAKYEIPFLVYAPIEGEPILSYPWRSLANENQIFTCSEYGARIVKRDVGKDIDWAYHGVDLDIFNPDQEARETTRQKLGWQNKFVISMVASNVGRKSWPRILESIAELKYKFKQDDIVFYAHTVPFDYYYLDGWNLPEICAAYNLSSTVFFHPKLAGGRYGRGIDETDSSEYPSLVDMYRASDLFVNPSKVEGFGLPIAEAQACGVPTVVTKYAAGWEVAGPYSGAIPVHDWEVHKSGVRYANVKPSDITKEILRLKRDPKRLQRMSAQGLERVKEFSWEKFDGVLISNAEKAISGASRRSVKQEKNKGNDKTTEENDGRLIDTSKNIVTTEQAIAV